MIKVKKNKIILLFGIASAALVSTAAISATVVKINSSYLSNQNAFAFNRSRSLELIDRGRAESRFNSNTDNNLEVPQPKKKWSNQTYYCCKSTNCWRKTTSNFKTRTT